MPTPTVLDTNVVVGLLDAQDVWSECALVLRGALKAHDCESDCNARGDEWSLHFNLII